MSVESIELRWTDWHLKPDENIPDDRYYMVRYCEAQADASLGESREATGYRYKNSTERRVIISNLTAGTLYDFSVKLIVGTRQSDWSMTTSQMTMEASETAAA